MSKYTVFDFGLLHLEWSTALFVFFVFVVVVLGMNSLLFRPIIRTIRNREGLIDNLEADKNKAETELNLLHEKTETKIKSTNQEVTDLRKSNRSEVDQEVAKIVDKAKKEGADIIQKADQELQGEMDASVGKLEELSESISAVILKKVV